MIIDLLCFIRNCGFLGEVSCSHIVSMLVILILGYLNIYRYIFNTYQHPLHVSKVEVTLKIYCDQQYI